MTTKASPLPINPETKKKGFFQRVKGFFTKKAPQGDVGKVKRVSALKKKVLRKSNIQVVGINSQTHKPRLSSKKFKIPSEKAENVAVAIEELTANIIRLDNGLKILKEFANYLSGKQKFSEDDLNSNVVVKFSELLSDELEWFNKSNADQKSTAPVIEFEKEVIERLMPSVAVKIDSVYIRKIEDSIESVKLRLKRYQEYQHQMKPIEAKKIRHELSMTKSTISFPEEFRMNKIFDKYKDLDWWGGVRNKNVHYVYIVEYPKKNKMKVTKENINHIIHFEPVFITKLNQYKKVTIDMFLDNETNKDLLNLFIEKYNEYIPGFFSRLDMKIYGTYPRPHFIDLIGNIIQNYLNRPNWLPGSNEYKTHKFAPMTLRKHGTITLYHHGDINQDIYRPYYYVVIDKKIRNDLLIHDRVTLSYAGIYNEKNHKYVLDVSVKNAKHRNGSLYKEGILNNTEIDRLMIFIENELLKQPQNPKSTRSKRLSTKSS